ncbi:DNA polymerase III subunit beta ['Cynodon dactylon' phytoplasma]|uniref:DNA polymerase III subunit beta n=1 Tax='Cynodon dactylon' phytoplasma TaxID=295320 RepID=UPI001265CA71|nr:DNA polymerase III subunit beta ['Cynodon dactylon' phytoplasma]KAB8122089.1 DNA polymerase III subunit beta ['Cynodon dactylon' phytoplasma]
MNFEIRRDFFLNYLIQIQKILPQKTFCPIYYSIKLYVEENFLFLEVSNMNIAVKIKIENDSLKIKKKGFAIISGKYFIDIIKKIDCPIININSIESNFLVIETLFSKYKLKIIHLDDFPSIDFNLDFQNFYEIEINSFKRLIKETNVTTSKDKQKNIILTGVNLIYQKPFLLASSTDSFRLSKKKIELNLESDNFDIILPNRSLEELTKLLEFEKEKFLRFFINKGRFFVYTSSLIFQTSVLSGNYPQLSDIKEKEFVYFFKLNKDKLIKIFERVSLFLPKEGSVIDNVVKFKTNINDKKIEISCDSQEIGTALEKIDILDFFLPDEIKIVFNIKYLEEIIKIFPAKEIVFSFKDPNQSFILNNIDDEKTLFYLILPFLNR